jgi:hypothetical protein
MEPHGTSPSKERRLSDDDDSLNADHVGVKSALDAVVAYEGDVGFYFTGLPETSPDELNLSDGADLTVEVDEKELVAGNKKRWDELLEDLMNGPAFDNTTDGDESLEGSFVGSLSSSGELHRSTSTFSTMTFSDGSIDSVGMPSTPKPKASLHDIEIKDISPSGSISGSLDYNPHLLSPTRSLNAAASSFVPTFCSHLNDEPLQFPTLGDKPKPSFAGSSSSDSFANFTFPTLNAHAPPPIKVKKDDGVFNEPQGHSSTSPDSRHGLLPPFLQEPTQRNRIRKSRTREIVDRLRSRLSPGNDDTASQAHPTNTLSPKYASLSPSPIGEEPTFVPPRLSVSEDGGDRVSRLSSPSCEEDDGWIDVSQPSVTSSSSSSSSNQKSKRARELLFALTRRRTDSLTSENLKEMTTTASEAPPNNAPRPRNGSSLSPSPSPSPRASATGVPPASDGWVESSTSNTSTNPSQKRARPRPPAQNAKETNKQHGQAQHNNTHNTHNRKKSANHVSRPSTSSASHAHAHAHSHSHSHAHAQFSAPASACYPHAAAPQHPGPHMGGVGVPAQALPYFFPAYPAVSMPVPYPAFMQMPAAYHLSAMAMHAGAGGGAPMPFAAMQASAGPAALGMQQQPLRTAGAGAAMKPSMAASGAAFRAKHAQPLW